MDMIKAEECRELSKQARDEWFDAKQRAKDKIIKHLVKGLNKYIKRKAKEGTATQIPVHVYDYDSLWKPWYSYAKKAFITQDEIAKTLDILGKEFEKQGFEISFDRNAYGIRVLYIKWGY